METSASMAQLTEATECFCAEYVGNYLYVGAKKEVGYPNYRYDTVSNSWETLPQILSHDDFCHRRIDSLCSVDDFLYAMSGESTCVPFRYCPSKNNWQGGANLSFVEKQLNNSNNRLTTTAATVCKSHIYVVHSVKTAEERKVQSNSGGQQLVQPPRAGTFSRSTTSAAGSTLAVLHGGQAVSANLTSQVWVDKSVLLHCFDPKANTWKKIFLQPAVLTVFLVFLWLTTGSISLGVAPTILNLAWFLLVQLPLKCMTMETTLGLLLNRNIFP